MRFPERRDYRVVEIDKHCGPQTGRIHHRDRMISRSVEFGMITEYRLLFHADNPPIRSVLETLHLLLIVFVTDVMENRLSP